MPDTLLPPEQANDQADQTQFETDAWLYEANKHQAIKPEPIPGQLPFWQTRQGKIMLIPLGLVVGLIFVAAGVMMARNKKAPEATLVDNQPISTAVDLGPLGAKVKALSQELKAADPTKELDPFPPVRLDLRLDEVKE